MSEPAYVCMECARTTSGKCAQHSYVPMPKQDILGECSALRKRVEELEAHRSVKMGLALEIERDRAMLRAELAEARVREYDEKLSTEMPKDMKDWWQNSKEEWPEVARWVLENRRKQILMVQRDFDAVANALDKLQAALDKLQADLDAALLVIKEARVRPELSWSDEALSAFSRIDLSKAEVKRG